MKLERSLAVILLTTSCLHAFADASRPWKEQSPPPGPLQLVILNCDLANDVALFSTLTLANRLLEAENEVVLFADREASTLGDADLARLSGERRDRAAELIDEFLEGGGRMLICPHCAKRFRIEVKSLRNRASFTTLDELEELKRKAERIFEYREPPAQENVSEEAASQT